MKIHCAGGCSFYAASENTLSINNVEREDGSVSWAIDNVITDKFKQDAKKWRNVRLVQRDAVRNEVSKRFERYDYYRCLEKRNEQLTYDETQKWIAKKNLETQGIQN